MATVCRCQQLLLCGNKARETARILGGGAMQLRVQHPCRNQPWAAITREQHAKVGHNHEHADAHAAPCISQRLFSCTQRQEPAHRLRARSSCSPRWHVPSCVAFEPTHVQLLPVGARAHAAARLLSAIASCRSGATCRPVPASRAVGPTCEPHCTSGRVKRSSVSCNCDSPHGLACATANSPPHLPQPTPAPS